jgi:hypothetical protein
MISFDFSYSIEIWHSMSVLQILLRLVGYTQLCPNGPGRSVQIAVFVTGVEILRAFIIHNNCHVG